MVDSIKIRDIEVSHIGELIQVEAIAVTVSIPESIITTAVYRCGLCNELTEIIQEGFDLEKPDKCFFPGCNNRRQWKLERRRCKRTNIQQVRLQERPEELPPGEIPEPLLVIMRGDFIRRVSPGDRVKIIGVVEARETKRGGVIEEKFLDVKGIDVLNRNNVETRLTDERIQQIIALSQQPDLEEILINSYCPSIFGWQHIKKGILRVIFGGVRKNKRGSIVRGEPHLLLSGDPGTAKTQMLLFGKEVCTRGIYGTGRGVTGVGLTAALIKEDDHFVLAAGTLALADMGNAFLDEFEKMNKEDREVIHVPMEQGIIPVSKGGLNATLNSRCGIVAAMNPIDGRYNTYKTLIENIRRKPEDFPDSLISRFDLIFIMADIVNEEQDDAISERILDLDEDNNENTIAVDLFRDYVAYSKRFFPTIPKEFRKKIKQYYKEKRREMKTDLSKLITPRILESIERLVEARARMHLREKANEEDLTDTLKLHEVYINEAWHDPYTGKVDTSPMEGLPSDSLRQQAEYLPKIIESIYQDLRGDVDALGERCIKRGALVDELVARSDGRVGKDRAQDIIQMALQLDLIWNPTVDKIKIMGDHNRMLGDEEQTLNTC